MHQFLAYYHKVSPATWVYFSSLLMIGLFFKFSRFWSVRNLDLVLLILLGPGLLLTHMGKQSVESHEAEAIVVDSESSHNQSSEPSISVQEWSHAAQVPGENPLSDGKRIERFGYVWLFVVGAMLLTRLLVDSTMVRRPLLTPNLSVGGLAFIGCALFVFLMANVMVAADESSIEEPSSELTAASAPADSLIAETGSPGYAVLNVLPHRANKVVAIASQFLVVLGLALVGYWHFNNLTMGIGAATLYLMMPYTSQLTGRVDHILPAAFLVWAILCYRQPLASGILLGFASGMVYYPLFLLPLWLSFYWKRGSLRFLGGFAGMLFVLAIVLAFSPAESSYLADLRRMFGLWKPRMEGLTGLWNVDQGGWDPAFRLPLLAAFVALSGSFALWPAQKNFGTLMSCSASLMLATQFWHGIDGGTYMAWYLPLALLTVFRPNLEDRVALSVLGQGWSSRRRRHRLSSAVRAA